jgi:hypothetical protein
MVWIDKIDAKLMPLTIDQTRAIGKMGDVLGKVASERVGGLNKSGARQRNQTGGRGGAADLGQLATSPVSDVDLLVLSLEK